MDSYRLFLLMEEIAGNGALSQRELAKQVGIALGLVNSYLKNLIARGFVRISSFPKNRYSYLLTPQGVAEKSRLACEHLSYFTNVYRLARREYAELFRTLESAGIRKIAFCGVDEAAEIAYLSLRETEITLASVMDREPREKFFGIPVETLEKGLLSENQKIVITSLKRGGELYDELVYRGVNPAVICRTGALARPMGER